jgi:predicted lipid-binding transport protein (Tim44 family)
MEAIIDWLVNTPLGLAAVIGGLVVLFLLIAFVSERKTRKLYPDHNRRGTKAKAKAKAKKKAKAEAKAKEDREKDAD